MLIVLVEVVSFLGFLYPSVNTVGFFIITVIALLLAVEKLEYGMLILLAELFIGSKGYLFSYEYEGALFSLRMVLFLVVMSAWLGKVVLDWIDVSKAPILELEPWMKRGKELARQARDLPKNIQQTKSVYFYYGLLFLAIGWGVVNGYLHHNGFENLFFDFNGWVYFGIIFPFAFIFKHIHGDSAEKFLKNVLAVFTAAISWLALKTLALFFVFSHDFHRTADVIYKWVRVSGVGEITPTGGGFSRIFLQSQIYVVIAILVFSALMLYALLKKKRQLLFHCFIVTLLAMATTLVSLSRSFWVGLAAGLLFFCFFVLLFFYKEWKKLLLHGLLFIAAAALSVALVVGIAAFLYPSPGIFNAAVFANRISQFSGEAAVASRWNLLPSLLAEIKKAPLLGEGFGAQVTYITQDPRILQQHPSGEYTTYAFEWGYLDIWLKLGLVGLLLYVVLLIKIFIDGLKRLKLQNARLQKLTTIALLSGLVMIIVTNVFTPYLNHPLGIGYVVLVAVIIAPSLRPLPAALE